MHKIFIGVLQFACVMFAISLHESAHAWMADKFGDPTAKNQGRITLNPIPHIDPIGTVIFPLFLVLIGAPVFGWAKPVMVNPYNLRNPKRDNIFISAAGPGSNVLAAFILIIAFLMLRAFNIVSLTTGGSSEIFTLILFYLILINMILAIFNLIPVPPLDGSGIIEGLLKGEALYFYNKIRPYGFLILILVIYSGIFEIIYRPILSLIMGILM